MRWYCEDMKTVALLLMAVAAATAQSYSSEHQFEYRVAGAQAPTVIKKSNPEYTEQARRAGIEGAVLLYVEIGTDGRPHHIRVIKGLGFGLDATAMDSVRQWRFRPGTKDGVPISTPATIEVKFKLADAPSSPVRV
jgi:TonB family protein